MEHSSFGMAAVGAANGMNTHICSICGKWFERKDTLKRHLLIHSQSNRRRKSRKKSCVSCIRCKVKCSGNKPSCDRCVRRDSQCVYEQDGCEDVLTPPSSEDFVTSQVIGQQDALTGISGPLGTSSRLWESGYLPLASQQSPMGDLLDWGPFFPRLVDLPMLESTAPNIFNDVFTSYLRNLPLHDAVVDPVFQSNISQVSQQGQQEAATTVNGLQASTEAPPLHRDQAINTVPRDPNSQPNQDQTQSTRLPSLGSAQNTESVYPCRFSLLGLDDPTYQTLQNCLRAPLSRTPWQPISLEVFPSKEKLDYLIDLYFAHFDPFLPMIHRPTFNPGENPALTLAMCAIGACYSGFSSCHEFSKSLCELLRRLLLFVGEYDSSITRSESHLTTQLLQSVLGKASGSKRLFELGDNNRGIMVANARGVGLFDHRDLEPLCDMDDLQSRWEAWIRVERSKRLAWCIYIFDASATYYRNCRPNMSLFEVKMSLPCSTEHWEAGSAQAWAALHPWTTSVPSGVSFQDTINHLFEEQRSENQHTSRSPGLKENPDSILNRIPDEFHRMLVATTLIRTVWDLRESLLEPTRVSAGPLAYAVFPQSMDAVLSLLGQLTTNALVPAAASIGRGTMRSGRPLLTQREFRGLVLRARISLIAQIIAADDITDHLALVMSRQPNRHTASEAAEKQLLAWARADPVQPRKLVHVGSRLLAVSRLYPFHYPREPFDALQGGMIVWKMLQLLRTICSDSALHDREAAVPDKSTEASDSAPFILSSPSSSMATPPVWPSASVTSGDAGSESQHGTRRICQLDWLGRDDAPEAKTIREWISQGGDGFILRMHGVSDLGTMEGERQVLLETSDVLRSMRVWPVAPTYLDIVIWTLQREYTA